MSDQELSQHCDQEHLAVIYESRIDPVAGKRIQHELIYVSDLLAYARTEVTTVDTDIEREDALIGDLHSTIKEAIANTETALTALRLIGDELIGKGK